MLEILERREMLHNHTPTLSPKLSQRQLKGYIGFDPTAPSLHIGNLATVMLLKHFQLAGHSPIILVGGATGMIGDPAGKNAERQLLDEDVLRFNEQGIKTQLSRFLDFETKLNPAVVVNNYAWFKDFKVLPFLREIGKSLTINYMLAKDSVKTRLESGLSFTEFSYQMLQAYDFYHLHKNYGVELQMGGSDQWGNITTGIELIRRLTGKEVEGLTCPLITRRDGQKFGKSEGLNIWLDAGRTSPYKFYQYWLNVSDEDAPNLLRIFTLLEPEVITALEAEHLLRPEARLLQKRLAQEVTIMVHGEQAYQTARAASAILFGKSTQEQLKQLDNQTLLEVLEGVPTIRITRAEWLNLASIPDLLGPQTAYRIFESKGQANRMLKGGGVSINKIKLNLQTRIEDLSLLNERYLLVQKGKKNYFLILVES